MANSNQIREFILTNHGVELREAYIGASGVLTGSARIAQEALENAEVLARKQDIEQKKCGMDRKRKALVAQIASLNAEFESEEFEASKVIKAELDMIKRLEQDKIEMAVSRKSVMKEEKPAK